MSRIARSEVVVPKSLSPEERGKLTDALYEVHRQIFDGVERESFAKYVVESKAEHTWIQVHKNEAGEIVGYFALHVFEKELGGVPTSVLRAEAGSLRAYRGGNANARWGLTMGLRYLLRNPGRRAFYLGSLVHPSSYSLFAKYFGEVWPRREAVVPPELLAFMDELATGFGLEKVDLANPLVRHVGWRTRETEMEMEREYWLHCDKPAARFFVEANPGYVEGHGLVTVVPITMSNVLDMIRSMGQRKLRQPLEATMALVQRTSLGLDRYGHLGRKGRLAWVQRGEHRELAARETLSLEMGSHVFVLSGVLELEHAGVWMVSRGSMLLAVDRPMQVRTQEATRLVVLPRESAPESLKAAG
jgi:hypothetical protein